MRAAIQPRVSVPPGPPPSLADHAKTVGNIRRLIWLYLILLVIEGSLRKWALPQLSNPLLIIRDPVAILIYLLAFRAHCFPWNGFVVSAGVIGMLSWMAGLIVLQPYLPLQNVVLVTGYGFRSDFLHLPLIFIIPAVFDIEDVKRVGWWTILGLIPMSLLMAAQFHAAPESFINRAAGLGEGQQIQTAGGKIRPPGTFSYISGAIFYLSAGTAFLLHAALSKLQYKNWQLLAGGLSVLVGVAISGSRGAVLAVGLVVASLGVILLVRPDAMTKFGRNLFLAAILLWAVSHVPIVREGVGFLFERFTETDDTVSTNVVGGLAMRVFGGFTEGLLLLSDAPALGYGLGIGTNGGAKFVTGQTMFLLTEGEWGRLILESGPILGLAFIVWRVLLTAKLALVSYQRLKRGEILPIMLFCAGFTVLLSGPFGQPSSVGFAIALSGLCLAATKTKDGEMKSPRSNIPAVRRHPAGRSAYASRLHGPAADLTNGSVDR